MRISHYIQAVSAALLVMSIAPRLAEAATAATTNPSGLTLDVVLARLDAREHRLRNFSYSLSETVSRVSKNGARTPVPPNVLCQLSRSGEKIRWTVDILLPTGEPEVHDVSVWDGSIYRGTATRKGEKKPQGMIRDAEPSSLTRIAYNNLLGYRKLGESEPLTISEWLRAVAKGPKNVVTIGIDAEHEGEQSTIKVYTLSSGFYHQTFWLDPSRDYMPVKYEFLHGKQSQPANWERHSVASASQVDGSWVPMRIVRITGSRAEPDVEGEYVYSVSSFRLGEVKDSDFAFEFQPGTCVVDSIKKIAYEVASDGSHQPRPFYSPATGEVTLDGKPMGRVTPQVGTDHLVSVSSGGSVYRLIVPAAGIVLIGVVAFLFFARRKKNPGHL